MKIIVLGGAGDMGSRTVQELAAAKEVTQLTIADRNLDEGQRLADRLASERVKVVATSVDANDHSALVDVMRGHDVAASAVGPYFRYETKAVAAAIDAGVDYASICDEWDATEAVFQQFGRAAEDNGRIILSGLGASPGVSNLGVCYLAEQFNSVRRADVFVYTPLDAGGGEAVIRHVLHIMTGDIMVWREGRRTAVRACSESRDVTFPLFGEIKLWNMGHAEPITIPRTLKDIEEVNFFMGYGRGSRPLVWPARLGLFQSPFLANMATRLLLQLEKKTRSDEPVDGALRLDVWGMNEGKEEHRLLCGTGQMREVTGVSLAVGVLMLGKKQLITKKPGVYGPEGCLAPKPFLKEMTARGLNIFEDLAMTRPLTL